MEHKDAAYAIEHATPEDSGDYLLVSQGVKQAERDEAARQNALRAHVIKLQEVADDVFSRPTTATATLPVDGREVTALLKAETELAPETLSFHVDGYIADTVTVSSLKPTSPLTLTYPGDTVTLSAEAVDILLRFLRLQMV